MKILIEEVSNWACHFGNLN